jgi:hypothetical protein
MLHAASLVDTRAANQSIFHCIRSVLASFMQDTKRAHDGVGSSHDNHLRSRPEGAGAGRGGGTWGAGSVSVMEKTEKVVCNAGDEKRCSVRGNLVI